MIYKLKNTLLIDSIKYINSLIFNNYFLNIMKIDSKKIFDEYIEKFSKELNILPISYYDTIRLCFDIIYIENITYIDYIHYRYCERYDTGDCYKYIFDEYKFGNINLNFCFDNILENKEKTFENFLIQYKRRINLIHRFDDNLSHSLILNINFKNILNLINNKSEIFEKNINSDFVENIKKYRASSTFLTFYING